MRICHYIKPNARNETPSRCIWFQAYSHVVLKNKNETLFGLDFVMMCRGVKDSKTDRWSYTWTQARNKDEFWKVVTSWLVEKKRTYLMCSNPNLHLSLLDAFDAMLDLGYKLTLGVLPPAPTLCRWTLGKKTALLIGAQNIWPTLSCDSCSGESPCSCSGPNGVTDACEHAWKTKYVVLDIQKKSIQWWQFLCENNLGGFSPTVGAQSIRVWRHRFMEHKVLIDCHDDALRLARNSIFGARCEVRTASRTVRDIWEVDTNGSYGGIMRDMRVPIKLRAYRQQCTVADVVRWCTEAVCVADVHLECWAPVYPVRVDGRLRFASGRLRTCLAGDELEYALKFENVKDVETCAIYEAQPAFRNYMSYLWNMRQLYRSVGNEADADKCKLLMQAFFGRWAQRGHIWEKVYDAEDRSIRSWIEVNAQTDEVVEYRQFAGIVQKLSNDEESRESHPAIAACILAGARMQLWRYMQHAGLENVYYVDTDSLFVNALGLGRLRDDIEPNTLGKLKIKAHYNSVTFHGPKYLECDGAWRHAGVPATGVHTDASHSVSVESPTVSWRIRRGELATASSREVSKTYKERKEEAR